MKPLAAHSCGRHSQGFTFIEVLIAVVILSIGLLGLAGLQATSQRANHSAYLRSQATLFAYDMADRMRANRTAMLTGAYNNLSGIPTNPGCITTGCSAADVALYDTYVWNTALAQQLPSGKGKVVGAGGIFTVTLMWDDTRSGATGTGCGSDPTVDLTCFSVKIQP